MPLPRAGAPVPVDDRLPMPPGTSPFHVKGHVYAKMKDDVEQTIGVARLAERLEDPAVREFWGQPFAAGSLYDALPMTPLAITHARIMGTPMHPFCREKGRIIAGRDVPGLYRAVLRLFSPSTLVGRLPRAAMLYFDFGVGSVEWITPNVARTTLSGVPWSLAAMMSGILEGFISQALELTRAPGVTVRTLECVYDGGSVAGVATAALRHESTWQE